jgi:hypothetical protein
MKQFPTMGNRDRMQILRGAPTMSDPAPETIEREQGKLWITDAEMIRRLGVPEKTARETIRMLDRQRSGFPQKQKLWGDRRFWPAVLGYFEDQYGFRKRK